MTWPLLLILLGLAVAAFCVRRIALISAASARRYLTQGARIVDVRDPDEFDARHLAGAINTPLSTLPDSLRPLVPDKNQVLLLHCLGGGRSAVAKKRLRADGYRRAYNLGSLNRAERIWQAARR